MYVRLWLFLVLNRKRTNKTWLLLPPQTLIVFESLSRNDACNSNGNHYLCCRRQNEAHINSPTIKAFWYLLWIILLILWFWPWLVVHIIDNIEMENTAIGLGGNIHFVSIFVLYVYYMNLFHTFKGIRITQPFKWLIRQDIDLQIEILEQL